MNKLEAIIMVIFVFGFFGTMISMSLNNSYEAKLAEQGLEQCLAIEDNTKVIWVKSCTDYTEGLK